MWSVEEIEEHSESWVSAPWESRVLHNRTGPSLRPVYPYWIDTWIFSTTIFVKFGVRFQRGVHSLFFSIMIICYSDSMFRSFLNSWWNLRTSEFGKRDFVKTRRWVPSQKETINRLPLLAIAGRFTVHVTSAILVAGQRKRELASQSDVNFGRELSWW